MAFEALTLAETDAKSPMDDRLWAKVSANFNDLDSRVVTALVSPFTFELQGRLSLINTFPLRRSFANAMVTKEFTPSLARYALKKSGTSGTLTFDLRKHTSPKTPITEIAHQYSGATQSIARRTAAVSTQSITRATPQISTQSITHAKAAINVSSIINVGTNLWQYNLASALDSDNLVGDPIVLASCNAGGNNGTFTIVEVGRCGGNNFTVSNASGVAQTTAAGTAQPKIMSYNFTNPVDSNFSAGEAATFASHTSGVNDGLLTIYAINQSGNNIWVKNSTGALQAGVAGTADTNRMKFNLSAAALSADFVVGESATTASHTTGANNGTFVIKALNSGGNNLVIYVSAGGATQGGAVGTIDTNRWKYSMLVDPTGSISVGHNLFTTGHTSALNDGTFDVKEINASAGTNLIIYNASGVVQAGVAGNVYTTRKLVKFASDQSATYTTDSYIEMAGTASSEYNYADTIAPFRVVEVNRGGGANYNVVVELATATAQANPAGFVQVEMKSVFSTAQAISADVTKLTANQNLSGQTTQLNATVIPANTVIMLYVTNAMAGEPENLTVSLM
jgi:hypothetical protein